MRVIKDKLFSGQHQALAITVVYVLISGISLQHELALRAIAWTLADRQCDDLSATLVLVKEEDDTGNTKPDVLLAKLEEWMGISAPVCAAVHRSSGE